jgi:hypothetical protein
VRNKQKIKIMIKPLLSMSLMIVTVAVVAQNDRSKKVKTQYLSLPAYDISANSPSSISIDFAIKDGSFGTEKLKDTKSKCMPKGGGLKDIVELTAYHYEVPFTTPESYMVARSTDGTVVYAEKSSESSQSSVRFGYDDKMNQSKCEYWVADNLKKDFASQSASFKVGEQKSFEDRIFNESYARTLNNVSMTYVPQEIEVYSAKGKDFDYAELDGAFDKAMAAYESIGKNGVNTKDFEALKEAIMVWEKELATMDTEDSKARINKSIGKGLHENCAYAYAEILDFDNAKKHAAAFDKLFGNTSTPRTQNFEFVSKRILIQSTAASKNETSLKDVEGLNKMASATKSNLTTNKLGSAGFEKLKSDFNAMQSSQYMAVKEELKKDEEAAIASGELNPYQKYYLTAVAGGEGVIINLPPSVLSGVPVLTEFPKEICAFTDAKQVMILKNSIASIPADIAKMTNLKKLDLTGNKLTSLPAEMGQLSNLETLKLNNNPLESLPAELANCKNLKTLTLKGTKVPASQIADLQAKLPNCKIK